MECFHAQRKQQTKISSNSVCWFPMAGGPLAASTGQLAYMPAALLCHSLCVLVAQSDSLRSHEL